MKRTGLKRATSGVLSVAMIASALFSDFSVPTSVFASDDTSSVETTLDGYSDSGSSITSEYIATNLDESLGEEAAALNEDAALTVAEEYLVSELAETSDDADMEVSEDTDVTSTDTETAADTVTGTNDVVTEIVSVSSNDADIVSTSSNDVDASTLSLDDETDDSTEEIAVEETDVTSGEETGEVTVSEEDVAALAEEILESADDITAADDYDTNGLAPHISLHHIKLLTHRFRLCVGRHDDR